jgi:hypothetical protein
MDRKTNVMHVTPEMTDNQADIVGVLSFSQLMVERLIEAKEQGKHGWHTNLITLEYLENKLDLAVKNNDYLDIANYAMMIYHKKEMLKELINKHED